MPIKHAAFTFIDLICTAFIRPAAWRSCPHRKTFEKSRVFSFFGICYKRMITTVDPFTKATGAFSLIYLPSKQDNLGNIAKILLKAGCMLDFYKARVIYYLRLVVFNHINCTVSLSSFSFRKELVSSNANRKDPYL